MLLTQVLTSKLGGYPSGDLILVREILAYMQHLTQFTFITIPTSFLYSIFTTGTASSDKNIIKLSYHPTALKSINNHNPCFIFIVDKFNTNYEYTRLVF
jgi:hypothetical protein